MNDLIIEESKIIMGMGDLSEIQLQETQTKIENYNKPWPVDEYSKKLSKNKCFWDDANQEVKAKTQEMLDIELNEKIKIEIDSYIIKEIPHIILECKQNNLTFAEFLDKIYQLTI